MKFKVKIKFDSEGNRLYVNKPGIFLLASTGILLLLALGIWILWQTNTLKVFPPGDENRPLGVAPAANGSPDQAVFDELKKNYANKFTIIFFYDGFQDQNEALGRIDVLKAALFSVEPFKSMQNSIAFKIFTTQGQACQVEGEKLVCDQRMLEGLGRLGIEHFKTVVISPLAFHSGSDLARGKNSLITISTDKGKLKDADYKRWLGVMFTQELGHSLGLRYEYFQAKASQYKGVDIAGKPNCADSENTAKEWWGKNGVYLKGCAGNDSYLYPEANTLMSDFPKMESYGAISEGYLDGAISCFYAGKDTFSSAGEEKSCGEFKKEYSRFWTE
ncbi:MAG: hypothetical protein ACM3IJ_00340 [Candidatus Levyibacteriota bacterium]